MKISELIIELQRMQNEHGNLEVFVYSFDDEVPANNVYLDEVRGVKCYCIMA